MSAIVFILSAKVRFFLFVARFFIIFLSYFAINGKNIVIKTVNMRFLTKRPFFMINKYLGMLQLRWLIVFISCCLMLIVACLYAFAPISKSLNDNVAYIHYMYAIQIIVVIVSLFLNKKYKKRLNIIIKLPDLRNKLTLYFRLNRQIIYLYIILVGLCSLSIMFVKSYESVIVPVILLLSTYLKRPYIIKLKMELNLKEEDLKK